MSTQAAIYAQAALNHLDEIGQGHSAAACHLDAALNALGHPPEPTCHLPLATVLFEELEPA